ncbi:MAG: ABC transporter ATP-binding protein [Acetobacteraceae bacterium]|nr:ABC transporter ATP-binding protein [Acetobacteraceae bacterium]
MRRVLEGRELHKSYGAVQALKGVSLRVAQGEVVGIIGPNGAGKSTLLALLAGGTRPTRGRVTFLGSDITGWPAHRVCRLGLARTFQYPRPLASLSVLENVMVGAFARLGPLAVRQAREAAHACLQRVGLADAAGATAGELCAADRKRLELARALATGPRLLLLDELMAGLTPREVKDAMGLLLELRQDGLTLVLVEHVMEAVMAMCDRLVVLDSGCKLCEGPPARVGRDQAVIRTYLGEAYAGG